MVSVKNGILKINREASEKPFGLLFEFCLFITLTVYFLFYSTRAFNVAAVAIGAVGVAFIVFGKIRQGRFYIPLNTIWYFIFFLFAELSSIWAFAPSSAATSYVRLMIFILVINLGISQYIDTIEDFERLLSIFILSATIIALTELIYVPVNSWSDGGFGSNVGGNNSNTFGFIVMAAAIISFYKGYIVEKKIYFLTTALFIFTCMLSGSRKATVMCIFGILFIVFCAFKKKHHMFHLLLIMILTVVLLIATFEIDVLYESVGVRLESMFSFYTENSSASVDNSLALRSYFIEFARQLFVEKPVLGHGFSNFAMLLGLESSINRWVYAHNNYWEILADLGIVGFIVYYWFYVFLIIKMMIKAFKGMAGRTLSLSIALIVTLMIIEWGTITMSYFYPQLIITFIFASTYIDDVSPQRQHHYLSNQKQR